jgi:hypothetical protein
LGKKSSGAKATFASFSVLGAKSSFVVTSEGEMQQESMASFCMSTMGIRGKTDPTSTNLATIESLGNSRA